MKRTPEQRAAIERAKKPGRSPFGAWRGENGQRERDTQLIVPKRHRLVRA